MSGLDDHQINTRLICLGFFVALFSAGIGIGGGTLLVSILISVFGYDFSKAASTSLSTIVPISFVGALSHFLFLRELPDLRYCYIFIPACVLGTIIGGRIVRKGRNRWLKIVFSVFLLILSLRMLRIVDFPFLIFSELHQLFFSYEWLLIFPVGLIIGTIAVSLGIGCGLLIVPFFVVTVHLNMHEAITISLTTMFFLSLSATIVNSRLKMLNRRSLKFLIIPALAGAVIGAVISSYLPTSALKNLFGVFLFAMGCKYLISELSFHRMIKSSTLKTAKGIK